MKMEMIGDEQGRAIEAAGIERVKIRSVLTCKTKHGVCKNATAETWPPVTM